MRLNALTVGVAALLVAAPITAQQRGTLEFGGFASGASFDQALSLKSAYGGGGRVGMYLGPRLSIEFEDAEMRASRPNGLANVNVGILSGRLVAVPFTAGPLSFLTGAGAGVSTETNFLHSYGVDALVGAKLALSDNAALRVDGVWDWLANEDWKSYRSIRVGLSLYRHNGSSQMAMAAPMAAPEARTVVRVDTVRVQTLRVDTVRVAPALPTGQALSMCLATGNAINLIVTAQGDTLVGPSRTSVRVLRENDVAFAGTYAQGRPWFDADSGISFDGRSFRKSGNELGLSCPDLVRVGDYQGVPLFVRRGVATPYTQLYVPVRPGVWQMVENLRATRGS